MERDPANNETEKIEEGIPSIPLSNSTPSPDVSPPEEGQSKSKRKKSESKPKKQYKKKAKAAKAEKPRKEEKNEPIELTQIDGKVNYNNN